MPVRKQRLATDDARLQAIRKYARARPDEFVQDYYKVITETSQNVDFRYAYIQQQVANEIKLDEIARKPVRRVYMKWRRAKVTTFFAARESAISYGSDNMRTAIVSHRKDRSEEILNRCRFFFDNLPPAYFLDFSRDNDEQIRFKATNQEIFIGVSTEAKKVRGEGIQRLLSSEYAFQEGFDDMLDEVGPVVPYDPDTSIIWESTGSMRGCRAHEFTEAAKAGELIYEYTFLCWHHDPTMVYQPRTDKERDEMFSELRTNFPDLNRMNEFFKLSPGHRLMSLFLIKTRCNSKLEKLMVDYPYDDHMAWQMQGTSFFDNLALRKLKPVEDHKWYKLPEGEYFMEFRSFDDLEEIGAVPDNSDVNYVKVWRTPTPNAKYIVSADTSAGYENSTFSNIYVIDMVTREMMANFHGRIRPDQLAHVIASLGSIYNDGLACPETNYTGTATLIELQKIYPYLYYFKRIVKGRLENTNRPGWVTSNQTRPMMLLELKKVAEETAKSTWGADVGVFRDAAAIDEMITFGYHGTGGRLQAAHGAFADRVTSLAIAHICASHEVYGTDMDLYTKSAAIAENQSSSYYFGSPAKDPVAAIKKRLGFDPEDEWTDLSYGKEGTYGY